MAAKLCWDKLTLSATNIWHFKDNNLKSIWNHDTVAAILETCSNPKTQRTSLGVLAQLLQLSYTSASELLIGNEQFWSVIICALKHDESEVVELGVDSLYYVIIHDGAKKCGRYLLRHGFFDHVCGLVHTLQKLPVLFRCLRIVFGLLTQSTIVLDVWILKKILVTALKYAVDNVIQQFKHIKDTGDSTAEDVCLQLVQLCVNCLRAIIHEYDKTNANHMQIISKGLIEVMRLAYIPSLKFWRYYRLAIIAVGRDLSDTILKVAVIDCCLLTFALDFDWEVKLEIIILLEHVTTFHSRQCCIKLFTLKTVKTICSISPVDCSSKYCGSMLKIWQNIIDYGMVSVSIEMMNWVCELFECNFKNRHQQIANSIVALQKICTKQEISVVLAKVPSDILKKYRLIREM